MAANCSELPEDVVYLVAKRLVSIYDLVRFGAVCKSWRRSFLIVKKEQVFAPLIMLAKAENDILPTSSDDENDKPIRSFIIPYVVQGQQHKMKRFEVELPKAQGRRCCGSPYGWVVTVGFDFEIHLLNPFTGFELPLPPLSNLLQQSTLALHKGLNPSCIIRVLTSKFVLGWNPSSIGELIVMDIFGQISEVAFTIINPGNAIEATTSSSWTRISSDLNYSEDVIFFQGRIFIIGGGGNLSVCDINQTPPKAIWIACPPPEDGVSSQFYTLYLVEICGHLHLVSRIFHCFGPSLVDFQSQTTSFSVYRFNFGENKWCYVYDLGKYALFVGNHTSFYISTTTYPDFSSNSIYFSDDDFQVYERPYCDSGVFNYEKGTIEKFDFTSHGTFSRLARPTILVPAL